MAAVLRRSLLYVPASSRKMLVNSLRLASDNITYDLEDSVTPARKQEAREDLEIHLARLACRPPAVTELAVRINAVSTPDSIHDLTVAASSPLVDAVVVPKVESAEHVTFVSAVLRNVAPVRQSHDSRNPIRIIALIESAKAVMNLDAISKASSHLDGLIFAAEDFALDLSITRTPSLTEFLYARSAIVTAARAARLNSAIDLVCTSYKGEEGLSRLREECAGGKSMGFNGKQCIHPDQLQTVQAMFAPSREDVDWAVRVVVADEKATAAGRGAWTLDGKMIDAPVVGKARHVVSEAQSCGFDVRSLRLRWADQEPE
ncbi:citrate lyase subunit beta (Citrate (pro-3S)-lyase subunit beta) [Ophiocordyceps camponoti-floridani]|uniref:Citrate lyase subunit beta (Citrate (Pro-3S)-lyase subunit beta) n=1 Tax=Ophiocordyceps camponoti-floridani TaxID=2030778 RepID=A0A8H4QBR2_9HYPO|nr:citrate lyase subunit beta (Citrate (pro-3S)-lyase subunit beta) [Ophiocordyceps camponoti-floridani]